MAHDPDTIGPDLLTFLTERHVATLTTLRPDGTPHVVPVGFTYDAVTHLARVITSNGSVKVHNVRAGHRRVAICQQKDPRAPRPSQARAGTLHGGRADAEGRYAQRYRRPRENPERVVLEISADRISGHT